MTTPREKYDRRRKTFQEYVETGDIDGESAVAIEELLDAYDDENVMVSTPQGEGTRAVGTLMSWLYRLMTFARDRNLVEATVDDLNQDVQRMHDGDHPFVKDDGIQKSTLRSYQAALRRFYRFHDFGVDPDEIPMFGKAESHVDPQDMLTKEEIHEARSAAENPRDRAIFDLLLYTGQRREALRTLRLKDVNVQEGTYRLNPSVDGLKGATDRNGNRPLLGAKGSVADWLEYHPDTSDPGNYLITARPNYSAVDPSEPVSGETIRAVMERLKDRTTIKKPMNPHAMRHNFVTIAKRDYDIPDDTIKYLIGHDSASTVMETTYSHLSGEDHVRRAEEAAGIREPDEESSLTPEICNVCSNPLEPNAKACANCGTIYTPDAMAVEEQIEEDVKADKEEIDDLEAYKLVDKLSQIKDEHPELVAKLLE